MPGIRGPTPRREARYGPSRWGQNTERGFLARQARSAGVPPAKTNAGKMPALQRGSGLNAVRESRSAGVPPAIHERTEKPRKRGLSFARGWKPRPGVKRRAEDRLRRGRPVNGPLCCAGVEMRRFSNKKNSYSAARSIILELHSEFGPWIYLEAKVNSPTGRRERFAPLPWPSMKESSKLSVDLSRFLQRDP